MKATSSKKIKQHITKIMSLSLLSPFAVIADSSDTLDDIFLSLAKEHPTFAGAYKDQGQLIILTTDGSPLSNVSDLSALDIDQESLDKANTEQAKYNFEQLSQANYELLSYVLELQENITGTDIDEKNNRVRMSIPVSADELSDKAALDTRRQNILARLTEKSQQSFDTDIFFINFFEASSSVPFVQVFPPFDNNIPSLFSALPQQWSGMSVRDERRSNCTWGFTTSLNKQRGFVHNSHCARPGFDFFSSIPTLSRSGTGFLEIDSPLIAKLSVDPLPISTSPSNATSVAGTLPPFCQQQACRHSDSQFSQFTSNFDAPSGYIARPAAQNSTLEINQDNPTFNITQVGGLLLMGDVVHKVGTSTGWTSGDITATCVNMISSSRPSLVCQDVSNANLYPGDSGSPVFTLEANGTDVRLRGLAHSATFTAGIHDTGTIYSPINQVMKDLGDLNDITVESLHPQPSLDTAQIPGYIHQGHVIFKNEETRTFTLDVLESGQYDITIQNSGILDSREIEVNIGEQTEHLSFDDFSSDTNLATITTEHLPQGQHELNITAQTTDIVLRQIQAVKSGEVKFPISTELADLTDRLRDSFFTGITTHRPNTIPGFTVGLRETTIAPQQTTELEIEVQEAGNYEFTLDFYIARNSQAIEVSFNGETVRRALDESATDIDLNPNTEVLSSIQTFKFFDVPKGTVQLSISSDATHDVILQPFGSALTIK